MYKPILFYNPELRFCFHFETQDVAIKFQELEKEKDFQVYQNNQIIPLYNSDGEILYQEIYNKLLTP